MTKPFTEEQKQYLQGYMAGMIQSGSAPFVGTTANGKITHDPAAADANEAAPQMVYNTPVEDLCKEERIKLEQNALDIYDKLVAHAQDGRFPDAADSFRFKFYGLFYVSPAQEAFMCRLRIPACLLRSDQLEGIAGIARDCGGGYADITTRGNVQVREISPKDIVNVLQRLYSFGLTSRGSGADNIRNITASPTSGFDPQELYDVRPLAIGLHHYILNSRDLYGLPRKFNVAFDNGGAVSVASDTNDIGFVPVVVEDGHEAEPGVYFRVQLGGITGHKTFAADTGVLLAPEECLAVAAAMIRVFNEHGDRTNRKKARLKYLLEDWGIPKFMTETEKKLSFPLRKFPLEQCLQRQDVVRHAHIGIHAQAQKDLYFVGAVIPVGRMTAEQMSRLAELARRYGKAEVRLTVFQNMIIPHVHRDDLDAVKAELVDMGFHYEASTIQGGVVACTGNTGCKFAATNTKGQAIILADYLDQRLKLDRPINIHLTGCHHSCAQHYCGDIGLLGVTVKNEQGESVEGYTISVGGGMDHEQGIGRELLQQVPFDEVPAALEGILKTYQERKAGDESFVAFSRRHDIAELTQMIQETSL